MKEFIVGQNYAISIVGAG
jgi:ATP-dependent Clp protease ATP-binding subunit ClpB